MDFMLLLGLYNTAHVYTPMNDSCDTSDNNNPNWPAVA